MALPEMFSSARSLFCQQQQQQQGSSLLWPSPDMVDMIGQSCQMQLQRQKSIPNSSNPTLLALHNHCPQGDGDGDGGGGGGGGERRRNLLPLLPNPSPLANGLPTQKRRRENEDNAEAIPPATESNSKTSGSGESEHSSSRKRGRCKPTKPDKSLVSHGNKNSVTMSATVVDEAPKDYVHVRARRGQATDSHSLAERVRREKISERMKFLQDLVPGCSKTIGKAVMLEEIINYVQSLQHQVEFLSMKLASLSPQMDFNIDNLLMREILPAMATANTSTTTNSSNVEQVGRMNEMGFNSAGNVPYHHMMMHQTPLPPHPSAQYGDPPHSLNGCNNSDMPLHFHQSSIPQQLTNTWDLTSMARRREEMDFYGSIAKSASNPE